ncbi:MAG TPA: hypothetical protein VFF52_21730, partial [Isosphaeraceae bacterium]|nr:hypothetical protein [Isosphaeraceae bacterium]
MEVVPAEGEVRLSGRALPPVGAQHYVLWLTREGSTDIFRLGEPKLHPDGTLVLDLVLPEDVPDNGWNVALLTVEDSATPARPGPRRSIAGRFPQVPANGSGTVPSNLPNTGFGGGAGPDIGSVFTAAGIAAAFGILVCSLALGRSARRRKGWPHPSAHEASRIFRMASGRRRAGGMAGRGEGACLLPAPGRFGQ